MGKSRVTKDSSSVIVGCPAARLAAVLLLFSLIPLAAAIPVAQGKSYGWTLLTIQPGVQNQYRANAGAGQKIVITTTVASCFCSTFACVTDYNGVIVNILLPNSSVILSTAPANSGNEAINTVTAPRTAGLWSLIVQVLWTDYPTGGTVATYQTTITINIT